MEVASDLDDGFLQSTRWGFQSHCLVERGLDGIRHGGFSQMQGAAIPTLEGGCGSADGAESFTNHAPAVMMALRLHAGA